MEDCPVLAAAANRWGYINQAGGVVIKPAYRLTESFAEGLAAVGPYDHPEKHIGFIDQKGVFVIPPQYEAVGTFRYGLCFVELADEVAYIDQGGSVVWRGPFVEVGRVSEL